MTSNHQQTTFLTEINKRNFVIGSKFNPANDATFFHGDRLELINHIKDANAKAELVVTSPPYNVGKEYEQVLPLKEYINTQRETIAACVEILSETGSICWQVGHYIDGKSREKEAFPLDLVLYPIFKDHGLKLRNRIVWHFGHGLHEEVRFSGRHETILWFTKDTEDFTFNLDPVRVPQKYPGKKHYRGNKKGKLSGNPKGKNPSDVWDMPNVKANHVEKTDHPCQFPIGLVERLILSMTNEGDLVFDPYLGVGSSTAAAILNGRRGAGSDIDDQYLKIAEQRAQQAWEGTLKYRDRDKEVYKPTGKEKISQTPAEWEF